MLRAFLSCGVGGFLALCVCAAPPTWPSVTREMKPWCYNWWMGSAVDEKGLTAQAEKLSRAGFGGFHVIPIYGAKGWEKQYRTFLSDDWMAAFRMAKAEGLKHNLGVDLTMGSGWCFGGPMLAPADGCWRLFVTANARDIKPDMKVIWHGQDLAGKPRFLVAALTGQKVKRAGPGGQGPMMDPFSVVAMEKFLAPYTAAFDKPGAPRPEHLYHDSYEYFKAAWTPGLFDAFARKRGYRLEAHLSELAGVGAIEKVAQIKCDYRETLSDLIIEDVFPRWFNWCKARGIATRNEGHGAPANWLDFYALADIPETEMFGENCRNILVSKFASSAAHVTGKRLVSSESCTWLNQHFTETLADAKVFLDRLFLSGVNHAFYHGCCYSPVEAPWPGWCFYAACQMNPRNPIWQDTDALSAYITRCQSVFQTYAPDNDVLVYWPLRDYWMQPEGYELQMSVHNAPLWFESQPIGQTAQKLYDAGYAFDYISDRMLQALDLTRHTYKALVVPPCRFMPASTRQRIKALEQQGLKVYWEGALPTCVPAEPFAHAAGLCYARYCLGAQTAYFIVNTSDRRCAGAFTPSRPCASAWTMNPLTGTIVGATAKEGRVALDIAPQHSVILVVSAAEDRASHAAAAPSSAVQTLSGPWQLTPVCGGPEPLPRACTLDHLGSWTVLSESFSGTMRYETTFAAPHGGCALNLGDVRQSARVTLNGRDLGKVILAPFEVAIPQGLLQPQGNKLVIEVTSTAANRIRWMDQQKIPWRLFHDINFASYNEGKWKGKGRFDASTWPLTENGLLGPVTLIYAP